MADDSTALAHAIAGCIGATAALGLFYPLDLVRTLRQAQAAANHTKREGSVTLAKDGSGSDGNGDSSGGGGGGGGGGGSGGDAGSKSHAHEGAAAATAAAGARAAAGAKEIPRLQIRSVADLAKLYHGFLSSVSTQGVSFFVYFFAFRFIQKRFAAAAGAAASSAAGSGTQDMVVAALAGGVNVLLTNPLWVASTEIKTRRPRKDTGPAKGMLGTLVDIYAERGVAGLWKGVFVSLVLVSNPAIQFAAYEQLKRTQAYLRGVDASQLAGAEFFLFGALAKATATLLTYPLQVAQTILRKHRNKEAPPAAAAAGGGGGGGGGGAGAGARARPGPPPLPPPHPVLGMVGVLAGLFRTGGLPALYTGLQMKFVQTVLTSAFMFLCYEKILRVVARVVLAVSGRGAAGAIAGPPA